MMPTCVKHAPMSQGNRAGLEDISDIRSKWCRCSHFCFQMRTSVIEGDRCLRSRDVSLNPTCVSQFTICHSLICFSLSQGSFCDLCNMCHRNQHVSLKLTCPIKRTCLNQSHMCHRSQHLSVNSICLITDNLSCKCVNNQQLCYPRMLVSRIQNVSQKPTCLTGVTQANMCQPSQHVSRGH